MYKATITVKLRPSILDPEGKAIEQALHSLSLNDLHHVRIGKQIEMNVSADSTELANSIVHEACKKLLANPVMEDYSVTLEEVKS